MYCTHLGWRGAPLVEMAEDILHVLLDLKLGRHPGVHPGGVLGAVQEGGGVDVGLPHRLEQRGHELQEVGPLAPAHPVAVVAAVQPVQAALRVQHQRQAGGRGAALPRPGPRPLDDVGGVDPRGRQHRVTLDHALQLTDGHPDNQLLRCAKPLQ